MRSVAEKAVHSVGKVLREEDGLNVTNERLTAIMKDHPNVSGIIKFWIVDAELKRKTRAMQEAREEKRREWAERERELEMEHTNGMWTGAMYAVVGIALGLAIGSLTGSPTPSNTK